MRLWPSPEAPQGVVAVPQEHLLVPQEERPLPLPQQPPAAPAPVLERVAEHTTLDERVALLRQAGDRYLHEDNDPEAALRCYTRALDAAPEEARKFSPDDNWLLMAIKNARDKETPHANKGG
jgi:hypothetical protein